MVPNWLVQYSYSFLYPAMINNRFHLEIVHGNECDNTILLVIEYFHNYIYSNPILNIIGPKVNFNSLIQPLYIDIKYT